MLCSSCSPLPARCVSGVETGAESRPAHHKALRRGLSQQDALHLRRDPLRGRILPLLPLAGRVDHCVLRAVKAVAEPAGTSPVRRHRLRYMLRVMFNSGADSSSPRSCWCYCRPAQRGDTWGRREATGRPSRKTMQAEAQLSQVRTVCDQRPDTLNMRNAVDEQNSATLRRAQHCMTALKQCRRLHARSRLMRYDVYRERAPGLSAANVSTCMCGSVSPWCVCDKLGGPRQ